MHQDADIKLLWFGESFSFLVARLVGENVDSSAALDVTILSSVDDSPLNKVSQFV